MFKITVKYNGAYPNLCRGQLIVVDSRVAEIVERYNIDIRYIA